MTITHLSDSALLDVRGADAEDFLQSQLSCDVAAIVPGRAGFGAWCSAKGRMLATLRVLRLPAATPGEPAAEPGFWLELDASLADSIAKRLSMFVLRRRCRVTRLDTVSGWRVWGLRGPLPQGFSASAESCLWEEPEGFAAGHLLVQPAAADTSWARAMPEASLHAWRLAEIEAGVPRVTAATSEHFVPQMLNLELLGGVGFRKGCYPGQEVVARSQYRGTLKRRLLIVQAAAPLHAAQDIFSDNEPEQPCGEVVNALLTTTPTGQTSCLALACLKLEAEHTPLFVRHGDGDAREALQVRRPPYPIPAQE